MADRIPLEKPSLSHTSQEPEGLAWAQIGTDLESEKAATDAECQDGGERDKEDDVGSDVGALRVDEDAELVDEEGEQAMVVEEEGEEEVEAKGEEKGETKQNGEGGREVEGEEREEAGDGGSGVKKKREEEDGDSVSGQRPFEEDKDKDKDKDRDKKSKDDSATLTNSNNPRRIRSRVFVGHLNTEKCSRRDVEKLFEPHGKIMGVSLQHGYGFVQFEDEEGARRAIREVHGQHFFGMKIVVDKPVALKKLLGEDPRAPAPWPDDRDRHNRERDHEEIEYIRRRSLMERYARLEELERYYYDRYSAAAPSHRDPYYDRYYPVDRYANRYRYSEREPSRERYYNRYGRGGGGPSYDRPRDDPYERREGLLDRRDKPLLDRRERPALLNVEPPFEHHDAAPFERHDAAPFERYEAAPYERHDAREGYDSFDRYGPPTRHP